MALRLSLLLVIFCMLTVPSAWSQTTIWGDRFGDGEWDYQEGHCVAVDVSKNVFLTGYFYGTVNFGGGPLTSSGGYKDIFLAKFDSDGSHFWSKRFGDIADYQEGMAVAVDGAGNVVLAGFLDGSADFGGGPLTSAGSTDIFVAKFAANGNHLWSKRFGSTSPDAAYSVALDASGSVILTGWFQGTVNFGGGALISAGYRDIFLAKFDPSGNHLWSKRFGDGSDFQYGYSVAIGGSGSVVLSGGFYGTVDFGGGPLASAGHSDMFLAEFNSSGDHLWSKHFGDSDYQYGYSVAVDASSNVLSTGWFHGTVNFGGGILTSAGASDMFLAKFNASGNHLWSKRFGDSDYQYGSSVAVDANKKVLLAGRFMGTTDFGGGPLTSAGDYDICLAEFDSTGYELWSRRFGDGAYQDGQSVAFDVAGDFLLTGQFYGTVVFDSVTLTSAGQNDIFLAKFSGAESGVSPYGSVEHPFCSAIYPNPVKTHVTISYTLTKEAPVRVEVYDLKGRRVATIVKRTEDVGEHVIRWEPTGITPGVYFYRVSAGPYSIAGKLVLL